MKLKRDPLNMRREKKKLKREIDPDLHLEIVSRLPFKEAVQCRCVCKSWLALLDDNLLINIHAKTQLKLDGYDHQHAHMSSSSSSSIVSFISFSRRKRLFGLFDDNLCSYKESSFNVSSSSKLLEDPLKTKKKLLKDATMINSCNGLVCLNTNNYDCNSIAIYNPVTTEFLGLPNDFFDDTIVTGGLGYHPSTKEYKILRTCNEDGRLLNYQTYTLGSTSGRWKNIKAPPLYWIIVNDEYEKIIMSFDLADEEFRILAELTLPPLLNNMKHYELVVMTTMGVAIMGDEGQGEW